MPTPFSGGCACGAIRYECTADPLFSGNCHCRDCQRASGSAFAAVLLVPKDAFTLMKDALQYHRVTGYHGHPVDRGFCLKCGSPVLINDGADPDHVYIQAASLDDPSWVQPAMDIFTASAQPWDHMNPALPKFEGAPTEDQVKALLISRGEA